MFIQCPFFYCIWTFITTDQLTNNETLCGFQNLISLQYTDYKKTDGLFILDICLWHLWHLSKISALTINDTVEKVSNSGLDECSVLAGSFYREETKLDQKAVRYSVLTGYGLFRVFKQRIIRGKNRDHGNRSVLGGVRFYQSTV